LSVPNGARVLITGERGFTGAVVSKALQKAGYSPHGLGDIDLNDIAAMRERVATVRPEIVIHLAAVANVAHEDLTSFYRVNVIGTMNLLAAVASEAPGVSKILLASSANVYGNPPVSPVNEDTPPAPVNHYAMSKLSMEYMAKTWIDKLPIAFTRPFNYTGPGQSESFLIPKIVGHYRRRESVLRLGNIDVVREYNDVRLIAQAYVGLLSRIETGAVVNLCTGKGFTVRQVLEQMDRLTGRSLNIEIDPHLVRANELKVLIGDPARLKHIIPDLPEYSLEETLTWMLQA